MSIIQNFPTFLEVRSPFSLYAKSGTGVPPVNFCEFLRLKNQNPNSPKTIAGPAI
ncbi:hypothetical protein QUA42_10145 [Microcoleus sp. Pol11C2]|uniref:hypothetical protein n=1 Tax=Microcoleus sp. Pol11C2 TaxID=3055389 RepID=UPI002FD602E6